MPASTSSCRSKRSPRMSSIANSTLTCSARREEYNLLFSEILGSIIREPRTLGVVEFLRIRVFPIIAPAGVDIEHVAGHQADAIFLQSDAGARHRDGGGSSQAVDLRDGLRGRRQARP